MLEDLGNIGDFLGGIGVVITLAYLATQIRANTRSVRSASLDSISTSISEFIDKTAQDSTLTKLWFDGLSGTVELSEDDRRRFDLLLISLARRWENAFHQSRAGALDSASWSGMQAGLTAVYLSPGAQSWWKQSRAILSTEFVEFAEGVFNEAGHSPTTASQRDRARRS